MSPNPCPNGCQTATPIISRRSTANQLSAKSAIDGRQLAVCPLSAVSPTVHQRRTIGVVVFKSRKALTGAAASRFLSVAKAFHGWTALEFGASSAPSASGDWTTTASPLAQYRPMLDGEWLTLITALAPFMALAAFSPSTASSGRRNPSTNTASICRIIRKPAIAFVLDVARIFCASARRSRATSSPCWYLARLG